MMAGIHIFLGVVIGVCMYISGVINERTSFHYLSGYASFLIACAALIIMATVP